MEGFADALESALGLVFAVAMLASFVWPLLRLRKRSAPAKAWTVYRSAARWSADPRLAFRGATAEILKQQEFGPDGGMAVDEPASVHVHARNAHGTCFFVIARDDGTVFVKRTGQEAAGADG